jgi:hypothetical protein
VIYKEGFPEFPYMKSIQEIGLKFGKSEFVCKKCGTQITILEWRKGEFCMKCKKN